MKKQPGMSGKRQMKLRFGVQILIQRRNKAFRKVVPKGEKIDPKKWNDEVAVLFDKREDVEGLLRKEVGDLACVEVIDYNKKNEERERSNDVHAKERAKESPHDRGKKHDFSR